MQATAGLLCCCATMLACAQNSAKPSSADKTLLTNIGFACLWWSESQMEGMNPNSPPPKNTEVKLTKWEYSDPIGVPHPDVVDAVVTLNNQTDAALSNLEVEVTVQWKTGPSRKASAAVWTDRSVLKQLHDVKVEAGAQQAVRVPVDLKKEMDELEKQKKWPFALRVGAEVRRTGVATALSQTRSELPITPGD
jgi:hypothetical protein